MHELSTLAISYTIDSGEKVFDLITKNVTCASVRTFMERGNID